MEPRPLTVKLLDCPKTPLATLFYIWEQSRTNDPLPMPDVIHRILYHGKMPGDASGQTCITVDGNGKCINQDRSLYDGLGMLGAKDLPHTWAVSGDGWKYLWRDVSEVQKRLWDTIHKLMYESVPVTENLHFTFHLQNISISLREQLVRHRIGTKIDDKIGSDIIPELASSTYWSQTQRVINKGRYIEEGEFMIPDSIKRDEESRQEYEDYLKQGQDLYLRFIEKGHPIEDARNVHPMALTHGITWTLNLKSMTHIFGKRACWVAQVGIWEKVMTGMVEELCKHVDPIFRTLIAPPCFRQGQYQACTVPAISAERVQGRDGMPPCPLYVYNQNASAVEASRNSVKESNHPATWTPPETSIAGRPNPKLLDIREWRTTKEGERRMLVDNIERFERMWKISCLTGLPLETK